jgi:predicted dithiol-disulfide oxidoreductase (DUF899 family)
MTDTDYTTAREELRRAELDLMLQREQVAALRRALPAGPVVDDYVFEEATGPGDDHQTRQVRLTELFTAPERTLVLYHFMVGKQQEQPCPSCTMWADGWAAVATDLDERIDFALVSGGAVADLASWAAARGWSDLRVLGAAGSTFKADIGGEDEDGHQSPVISVYRLTDGRPRLTYSGGAHITGDHWRGVDLLSPVWHLLDLTPEGRGDWMPSG